MTEQTQQQITALQHLVTDLYTRIGQLDHEKMNMIRVIAGQQQKLEALQKELEAFQGAANVKPEKANA